VERLLDTIDRTLLNLEQWPGVCEEAIKDPNRLMQYKARRRAVELLVDRVPIAQIQSATGISGRMALHWLRRALRIHPDGLIFGFRALIPWIHIVPYRRHATVDWEGPSGSGGSGAFDKLLRDYPELKELIDGEILKKKRKQVYESRISIKSLHKRFLDRCRELDLDIGLKYPFNTTKLAYVALSEYVHELIKANVVAATSARFGSDVAKKLQAGDGSARPVSTPFSRVECDAHHIDAIFCILIPSIFGDLIPKVVHRLWLIVVKEVVSRAILGYHLSLRNECNTADILEAVRNSLRKWEPRELLIPTMQYADKAGFPSSYNERLLGACWDEFSVDAGLANLSGPVISKLKDVVDASPVVLPRHNPNDRPFVERFFGVMEEAGFHRLPNTTGSGPMDPRRKNPELAAVKYTIQLEYLEDLVDVLIANSNSTPHSGIGYRTPLEYLEFLCAKDGRWPRQADPSKVERILSFYKTATVRGGVDIGRRPYVPLYSVNYSSDILKQSYGLLGKKLSLEINRRDLRTVRAYSESGAELGILRAAPPCTLHLTPWRCDKLSYP
jgi:putative transposase